MGIGNAKGRLKSQGRPSEKGKKDKREKWQIIWKEKTYRYIKQEEEIPNNEKGKIWNKGKQTKQEESQSRATEKTQKKTSSAENIPPTRPDSRPETSFLPSRHSSRSASGLKDWFLYDASLHNLFNVIYPRRGEASERGIRKRNCVK